MPNNKESLHRLCPIYDTKASYYIDNLLKERINSFQPVFMKLIKSHSSIDKCTIKELSLKFIIQLLDIRL